MTNKLIAGFKEFRKTAYNGEDALMPALVRDGQDPRYFIISCIDSRANPGTVFQTAPGTFFAHKAMGAIVRPYKQGTALAAALHFALNYNNVDTIVILGHTQCGAVNALCEGIEDEEIVSFIEVARNALTRAQQCTDCKGELLDRTVEETVLESAKNLETYPSVIKALSEKRVKIVRWVFDMKAGDLLEFNDITKKFEIITTNKNAEDSRKNA